MKTVSRLVLATRRRPNGIMSCACGGWAGSISMLRDGRGLLKLWGLLGVSRSHRRRQRQRSRHLLRPCKIPGNSVFIDCFSLFWSLTFLSNHSAESREMLWSSWHCGVTGLRESQACNNSDVLQSCLFSISKLQDVSMSVVKLINIPLISNWAVVDTEPGSARKRTAWMVSRMIEEQYHKNM